MIVLALVAPARAEEGAPPEEGAVAVTAAVDAVMGFRATFEPDSSKGAERDTEPKESRATSVIASLGVALGPRWALGLRVPVTTADFLFAENDSARVWSLGNTELSAKYTARPFVRRDVELELELGLAIPTATGDEYGSEQDPQRHAFANLAAQRFRGYLDNALFSPHRFGVVPKATLGWEAERWAFDAFSKLEFLADRGGTAPPPELGTLTQTALELVSGVHAQVAPFRDPRVRFGVRSWIAWTIVGEVKEPDRTEGSEAPRLQWVVTPEIAFDASPLRSSLGFIAPIGGLLGRTDYLAMQFKIQLEF